MRHIRAILLAFFLPVSAYAFLGMGTVTVKSGGNGTVTLKSGGAGTVFISSTSNADVELGSLLAYWKLDDNGGTTATDSAGTFTGTLSGGPTWVAGISSSAVQFASASSQFISIAGAPVIGDSSVYTINLWEKNTQTGATSKLYSEANTGNLNNFIYVSVNENVDGDVEFGTKDSSGVSSLISSATVNSNNGNWHMITAISTSKSNRSLYFDGVFVGSTTATVGTVSSNDANIGKFQRTTSTNFTNGTIDQVRIYSVALSTTQIAHLYSAQK